MLLNRFTFHSPKTLNEASQLYGTLENVKIQAGGTFLLNSLKLSKRKGTKTPEHVISLYQVNELKGVQSDNDQLSIKAMTTIDELFESTELTDNFSILHTVCRNISTQPIRNMATVGGNLTCRYTWTEMPAAMTALDAKMHFVDVQGKEDVITAEAFFQQAAKTDKIFTQVSIPRNPKLSIAYQRVRKSQGVDIPMLSLMITTQFEGKKFTNTRVGINNCVSFAQRDTQLEDFLNKSECSKQLPQDALTHLTEEIYDKRSDFYKKHMFRVSIKNAIKNLVEQNSNG